MPFKYESAPTPSEQEIIAEKLLAPKETLKINIESPIADSQEVKEKLGLRAKLVAVVSADIKDFFIVDTRNTSANRDFLIVDDTFSSEKNIGYKGIEKNKPVIIGRDHYKNRFVYPETVSRNHFEVLYKDDELFVRNLEPTNNTTVTANLDKVPFSKIDDNLTHYIDDAIGANPNYGQKDETAPYGYYMNHPILGRASRSVENGVYLNEVYRNGQVGDAIVIDSRSDILRGVYDDFIKELKQKSDTTANLPSESILLKVVQKVQEVMPYDGAKIDASREKINYDQLISLSTFIKERAGVCRHQGLLAAYIIERLINDGQLTGSVGIERNYIEDFGESHAWAVYKTRSGGNSQVIVVDPAGSFVGTKKQAQKESFWNYNLSTD